MIKLLKAKWVVGHVDGRHCLYEDGEIAVSGDSALFVGKRFPGTPDKVVDYGNALIGPGFIDLDAVSDLDTTVLGFDNQPPARKGRVWPETYMRAGPIEMYSSEELAFQKKYAFSRLIRSGITTALPIASLFYRQWGETVQGFSDAAAAAEELGLRVYLGPAYQSGNTFVRDDGTLDFHFDEARGIAGLRDAEKYCAEFEGRAGGLICTMLVSDRIETCTAELLRQSAAAARDLQVPIRLHCCQSRFEYDSVVKLHGMTPPEWLESLGFLSERALLPHGTFVSGKDLEIIRDSGATIVHCPLVAARHGNALRSFRSYRDTGIRIGMGTDTYPPDMLLNMQLGLMICRVVEENAQACRAEDYYDAATVAGADALGRPDLGRLQPGAKADLIVVDFDDPFMGQTIDPIQTLLLNATARSIRSVMINGRFVMEDGVIPGIDDRAYRQSAQARFDGLVAKYPMRTLGHPPLHEIFSSSYRRLS
ncbi:MAG TPA: amidohydrolase family protein [Geminicoccaceae bacterium]|nr:amidohydrolase family protein [Geminicoccus sp.]HMU52222.1 amidohydrolase family protein [Geminicoccaceae bacterium]